MPIQSVFQRHSFDVLPPLTSRFRRAAIEDALRSAGVIGHSEQSVRRRGCCGAQRPAFGGSQAELD
jgi:hypothetical protein